MITSHSGGSIKGPVDTSAHGPTGGRRLGEADDKKEDPLALSDRFLVELAPSAVQYKVDKDLIQALIRRQAFRGIEDGRERELGAAKIVGFRLHDGDSKPSEDESDMMPVGPEEKFEVDFTHHHKELIDGKPRQASLPLFTLVAGAAVLATAALVAGIHRLKHGAQAQPYVSVESELEVAPAEE